MRTTFGVAEALITLALAIAVRRPCALCLETELLQAQGRHSAPFNR